MTAAGSIGDRLGRVIQGNAIVGRWVRAVSPWDDRNIGKIVQVGAGTSLKVQTAGDIYWAVPDQLMYWAPLPLPHTLPAGVMGKVGNNKFVAKSNLIQANEGRWRGRLAIAGFEMMTSGTIGATDVAWETYWGLIEGLGLEERLEAVARAGLVEIDEALEELAKLAGMLE